MNRWMNYIIWKKFRKKKLWFHRACRRYFLSKISTLLEAENISDQVFMTSKVPLYWLPALVCMGQKKLRLLWGKNWARRVTFHLWCKSDVNIQGVLAWNVTFFSKNILHWSNMTFRARSSAIDFTQLRHQKCFGNK